MAEFTGHFDNVCKEYLLYRGCVNSHKLFEKESATDKLAAHRAEKLVEVFHTGVTTSQLNMITDLWGFLDQRIFIRLQPKLEDSRNLLYERLLKFYLATAHANGRNDKVAEFFHRMTNQLQPLPCWKDWFAFPFTKSPEDNSTFAMFFRKTWGDVFWISLFNFFSVVFVHLPLPMMMQFEREARVISRQKTEIEQLREKLANVGEGADRRSVSRSESLLKFSEAFREESSAVVAQNATEFNRLVLDGFIDTRKEGSASSEKRDGKKGKGGQDHSSSAATSSAQPVPFVSSLVNKIAGARKKTSTVQQPSSTAAGGGSSSTRQSITTHAPSQRHAASTVAAPTQASAGFSSISNRHISSPHVSLPDGRPKSHTLVDSGSGTPTKDGQSPTLSTSSHFYTLTDSPSDGTETRSSTLSEAAKPAK